MREYGKIQCSFWTDPDIHGLSQDAREIAVYLLVGPHSNSLGCYRLPLGYVQEDLNQTHERVSKGLNELEEIGFSKRCNATGFVLIRKFLYWNKISNGNIAKNVAEQFEGISHKASVYNDLIACLLEYGLHFKEPFLNRLETLSKGLNETEKPKTKQNKTKQSKVFTSSSDEGSEIPELEEEVVYETKKGRKLKGNQLSWFEKFWEVFNHKTGKSEAADSWLDLKVSGQTLPEILKGAEKEAKRRPSLLANKQTPKMAQGWLSARRWEDELHDEVDSSGETVQRLQSGVNW